MNQKLQEDIRRNFEKYMRVFPQEEEKCAQWKSQIDDIISLNDRKNMIGHATASGIVISPNKKVLLIFHNAHHRYQQPGGHIDDDDQSMIAAALREVQEETGLMDVVAHPWHEEYNCPINIDSHPIPARKEKNEANHFHHDHMFVFTTQQTDIVLQEEEVSNWKWVTIEDITLHDGHVATSVRKAQAYGLL